MKMFRLAWAGVLPALVLLVATQSSADAAGRPQSPAMQSSVAGDSGGSQHIWLGPLSNSGTQLSDQGTGSPEARQLSLADRVAYQRAIEEVYWRHRIWPRNRGERPGLDAVMSRAAIEKKVQDYLWDSELLEAESRNPVTPQQLQVEMERMAQHSKQPEVLRELFAALEDDPFVIAECLAKPVLIGRLQFAKAEGGKEELESSSARAQAPMPVMIAAAQGNYSLPLISRQPSDCIDDNWTATTITNAPKQRDEHTAVWTGTEMIVWGGEFHGDHNIFNLNTGGRYNPSTDSWAPTSMTNLPTARSLHTAVWTGTEMIVWGGLAELNTGGRYNPSTDSWTATSTTNAPTGRGRHTAVWTGSEMIVWGGFGKVGSTFTYLETGGRYNPDTDSWTATSTTNAPTARSQHTAVWTGSEMIVWGGAGLVTIFDTGGRYNPGTDSWAATSTTNAPSPRIRPTGVWTGTEMIVWGGFDSSDSLFQTGGRYNPGTDNWTATSTTNAPTGRSDFTAVWTGSEMIVWGGFDSTFNYVNTGGRYNPGGDSWMATNTINAPTGRYLHTAVWTGSEMIVWGGDDYPVDLNTGGRYCAQAGMPAITLDAKKRNPEEINTVRLKWSGASSTNIDVYRNGTLVATTPNDGTYIDSTGDTGRARYTYQVCEAGTQACSNEASVTFAR